MAEVNAAYQKRRRSARAEGAWHPGCKTVSIGNITSGGSGKTPFCIYLAELLGAEGISLGISHRGYRGAFEHKPVIISEGKEPLFSARESGDEAHLLASRLQGIPVVVGRQRQAAISLLLEAWPETQVLILDDAFQNLRVARDLDILCFDAETGIGNGRLIPAGYLREPLDAIDPDTLIVINHKGPDSDTASLESMLRERSGHIFHCHYRISGAVDAEGKLHPVSDLRGKRAMLVSGIANPASFEQTARSVGISWLSHFQFPDHHPLSDPREIARIAELAAKYRVGHLVCTEKDLAKLSVHKQLRDSLFALRIGLDCPEASQLKELIRLRLEL
ncbi:MAG: tetraacyldisaccharide 4'-kinase [Candidatus Syntrophosphaera sp.]|nr:tetraacyldisaccharide 4'-kinase [Candidatus Syntrophosphaera sp.]